MRGVTGSTEPIPGRCGSPLRNKPGRFCQQPPAPGRARCRLHGGASLRGVAHPNWKHGMYDGTLPTGMAEHYRAARANPALTALTEQIALVDAKVFQLFEQLAQGESPAAWQEVVGLAAVQQEALDAFHTARRAADAAGITAALQALTGAIERLAELAEKGAGEGKVWNVIVSQIYLRKKLVDSEVRRQKAAHDVLTKERALSMLGFIAQSISRHVTDPKQKLAVVNDMRMLLSASDGASVLPGDGLS